MTKPPIRLSGLVATAACAALAIAGGACAHHKTTTTPAPDSAVATTTRAPVLLHVANSNWADVRVYLVRGAMWVRLGLVSTNGEADFTIPVDFVGQSGSVTLVAYPVAGTSAWTSPLTSVAPGDELELVVESFLQYSHLVVH